MGHYFHQFGGFTNNFSYKGFDFNERKFEIAKKNSKKLRIKNYKFYKKEFFKIKKKYDFVICTAAIHHLPNPYEGLKYLKSRVKKNGFLLISFGLDSSNIPHNLIKLIVRNWGKSNNEITKTSKYLFKNHIDRCVSFSCNLFMCLHGVYRLNSLALRKVFKTLNKNFSLHSSWPPKFIPQADSLDNITIEKNNFTSSEFIWSSKTFDDKIRLKKFSNTNNYRLFEKFKKLLNNNLIKHFDDILKKYKFLKSQKIEWEPLQL